MTVWLELAGLGTGSGAALVLFGLVGARQSSAEQMARHGLVRRLATPLAAPRGKAWRRVAIGSTLLDTMGRVAPKSANLRSDLAVTGRSTTDTAVQVATASITGLVITPALAALAALAGIAVPLELPLAGCAILGVVFALLPVISLRRAAGLARRRFRQALGCWLELVALAQAAGMGLESALNSASTICDDESFRRIRLAVDRARHAGRTPWAGLSQLGEELAIPELLELGATLSLAGVEGARVRGSLSARAVSLRQKELSEAEADANSTTERLFLPSIVLMFGFLVFVGYPAVVTLTHTI